MNLFHKMEMGGSGDPETSRHTTIIALRTPARCHRPTLTRPIVTYIGWVSVSITHVSCYYVQ